MMDDDVTDIDLGFDVDIEGIQVIELGAEENSDAEREVEDIELEVKTTRLSAYAIPVKVKGVSDGVSENIDLVKKESGDHYRGNFVECEYCQANFRLKRDLRSHVKECHPDVRFRCNICDKEFKYEESMYRHRVNVHPVKEVVVESNVEVRSSSHTEVQETTIIEADVVPMEDSEIMNVYIFECSYCALQFPQQSDLEEHLTFAHGHVNEGIDLIEKVKEEGEGEESFETDDATAPTVEYICDQCELCFITNEDLLRHKSGHKQKQVFECGDCGKRFATERKVTRHLAVHQQYLCPVCNKMFKYSHVMRRHIRMCHSTASDTLYLCPGCDKTFGCPDQMKRHQLVHNSEEEKKFACDMCPMRFNYSHTLKRHKMGVHNLLPPDKLISCEYCEKVFKSKDMLKRHYRSHTNERPHICEYCSRAFQFAFVLRRHMLAAHPEASSELGMMESVEQFDHGVSEVSIETEIS